MLRDNYTRYPRAILWLIREGSVRIGGPDQDSQPPFEVTLNSFYIGKSPITNRQFEAFRTDFTRSENSAGDDDCATGISFHEAQAYCDWYAGVSRKPMRLPTELEWEYACRAGKSGDPSPPPDRCAPNGFGLHGMLGAIWEWTSSPYASYPLSPADTGTGERRVLRGGSMQLPLKTLHCGRRRAALPTFADDDVGFRIVRSF